MWGILCGLYAPRGAESDNVSDVITTKLLYVHWFQLPTQCRFYCYRILSPVRLPVSPSGHRCIERRFSSLNNLSVLKCESNNGLVLQELWLSNPSVLR